MVSPPCLPRELSLGPALVGSKGCKVLGLYRPSPQTGASSISPRDVPAKAPRGAVPSSASALVLGRLLHLAACLTESQGPPGFSLAGKHPSG